MTISETNIFERILSFIPAPADLQVEAKRLAEADMDGYSTFTVDAVPNFDFYQSNDGGGQDGNMAFYKEHGEVIAAFLYAYDHESVLAPNIDTDEIFHQFALTDLPAVFLPAVSEGSPFLWNFDSEPNTSKIIVTTSAAWNTGDTWEFSPEVFTAIDSQLGRPVKLDEMGKHLKYSFKSFGFVERFKTDVN